jgi:predicted TIM-barrel fold metal-dependent hydrolase
MGLVDFHTHWFSRTYFETLAAQSPLQGSVAEKLEAVAKQAGFELPPTDHGAHAARWLAELERHQVDHIVAFGSVPEETPVVAAAAAASKGRVSAMALVNPLVEGVPRKVDELLAKGAIKGVLCFPALHRYAIDGDKARELWSVLDAHAAIAYVHCGLFVVKVRDLLGLPRTHDVALANPLHLVAAANAAPRCTFVVPHFGAGFLRETLMAGMQCGNIVVDTSSSNGWMATACPPLDLVSVYRSTLACFGARRILFGSDSNVFPAGWRADRAAEHRAALQAAGASDADAEAIFSANARRLLRL